MIDRVWGQDAEGCKYETAGGNKGMLNGENTAKPERCAGMHAGRRVKHSAK